LQNELILQAVLDAFTKALTALLKYETQAIAAAKCALFLVCRGSTDKFTILENYEMLLLCIDETVDKGYALRSVCEQTGKYIHVLLQNCV